VHSRVFRKLDSSDWSRCRRRCRRRCGVRPLRVRRWCPLASRTLRRRHRRRLRALAGAGGHLEPGCGWGGWGRPAMCGASGSLGLAPPSPVRGAGGCYRGSGPFMSWCSPVLRWRRRGGSVGCECISPRGVCPVAWCHPRCLAAAVVCLRSNSEPLSGNPHSS
jgi:hypothetical protein